MSTPMTSKDAHGMPPLSTTCSLGKPSPQGRNHTQLTLQNTMIKMLKVALANQITNKGHVSDWIDTALHPKEKLMG